MPLEVGKKYKLRDGSIVIAKEFRIEFPYQFLCLTNTKKEIWVTINGAFFHENDPSPYDIVSNADGTPLK